MEDNVKQLGDAYVFGSFMYENSRIARNQIKATNMILQAKFMGWTEQMEKEFKLLKEEADELVNNPEAVEEYRKAKESYSLI